jgi:hypothetical protein
VLGGSVTDLSVTDGCRWRGGDFNSMLQCEASLLVNIAHSREVNELGQLPSATAIKFVNVSKIDH